MKTVARFILCFFCLFIVAARAATPDSVRFSTIDSLGVAELTLQEKHLLEPEFYPLLLHEKGRQSVSAWRGMPAGFLDYQFGGMELRNPVWGTWDNQLVPMEYIRHFSVDAASLQYQMHKLSFHNKLKPISRIAYTQDFQFGLTSLDASLNAYYRENSYFELGGSNMLRNGFQPGSSKIHVNNYRVHFHHALSEKLNFDLWYLELHHRFFFDDFIASELGSQNHRVHSLFWLHLNYAPDNRVRLRVTPIVQKWGDYFRNKSKTNKREANVRSLGAQIKLTLSDKIGRFGVESKALRHDIFDALQYQLKDQLEMNIVGFLETSGKIGRLKLEGGYQHYQSVGNSPSLNLQFGRQISNKWFSQISAAQKPANLPLTALFREDTLNSRLSNTETPLRQSIEWKNNLRLNARHAFQLSVFWNQFKNNWAWSETATRFYQRNDANSGISLETRHHFWKIDLSEKFIYHANYDELFTPQFQNVLTAHLPTSLFSGALKLDGYAILRTYGENKLARYHPAVNQFTLTNIKNDPLNLLDFKLLAHIQSATLFFIWENPISTDYAFVENYNEFYRQFRFGVYWTFFD